MLGKYIEWFGKHRERLGITKQSLIDSINNSEVYIKKLLETNFVDESIHVKNVNSLQMDEQKNITTDIYYNFFTHVLDNMEQPSWFYG